MNANFFSDKFICKYTDTDIWVKTLIFNNVELDGYL